MKRKVLIISVIGIIISLFSISYTFAANNMNNMAQGIRNAVGEAENVVEGAGSAVGRVVQDGMNTIGNGARNIGNATENTVGTITNNDKYTATRTATGNSTTNNSSGMSSTVYTWIIIAITAVGIGVLLWSYIRQNNKDNMYIDSNDR